MPHHDGGAWPYVSTPPRALESPQLVLAQRPQGVIANIRVREHEERPPVEGVPVAKCVLPPCIPEDDVEEHYVWTPILMRESTLIRSMQEKEGWSVASMPTDGFHVWMRRRRAA